MSLFARRRGGAITARAIIDAANLMYERGLVVGTVGNLSARSGDTFLITPTRRFYDELRPADLVRIPITGAEARASPKGASREWRMHAAIYTACAEADAVAHTHSPFATARSFDPTPLRFATEERSYLGIDRIETVPESVAGSPQLAHRVSDALTRQPGCLIARHGVATVGDSPRGAVELAAAIEHQAQIQWLIRGPGAAGGPISSRTDLTQALTGEWAIQVGDQEGSARRTA